MPDESQAAADLLAAINATEGKLVQWASIHASPGYTHQIELLALFKGHADWEQAFCDLVHWDRSKLTEMLTTLDNQISLGDQVATDEPRDKAILEKVKNHPFALKLLGQIL